MDAKMPQGRNRHGGQKALVRPGGTSGRRLQSKKVAVVKKSANAGKRIPGRTPRRHTQAYVLAHNKENDSQSLISNLIKKAREAQVRGPSRLKQLQLTLTSSSKRGRRKESATPYQVCEQYAKGRLTDDQLVDKLGGWHYEVANNETDGVETILVPVSGSFDDVLRALHQGLINLDLYERVLNAVEENEARWEVQHG